MPQQQYECANFSLPNVTSDLFTGDFFETQPCRQELLPIQTSLRAFCRRHRHWILLSLGFVPSLAKIPKKIPFYYRNGNREISSFCRVQKPPAYHQVIKQYNAPQMCNLRVYELQKILHWLVSLFLDYGDTFCHDSSHAGLFLFYNISI